MTECWLPVVGHEGLYEVSDHGHVRSVDRVRLRSNGAPMTLPGRDLKGQSDRKGYLYFTLSYADARRRKRPVHQLVLEAFVGPRPQGQEVRHLDGDPANNSLQNLRYGTSVENAEDQRRHGRLYWASRTHCESGHEYTPENTAIRLHNGYTERVCRECSRQRLQKFWARRGAA